MSSKVEVVSCTVICLFFLPFTVFLLSLKVSVPVRQIGSTCVKARLRTPAPDAVGG